MYKSFFKRFFDILCALLLLIVLSPIMIIVAVLIKFDSKGPAIFKQIRSGKNGKNFTLYKFRSMTCNNDFYDKSEEDQVTKVGAFIRKTSLDELPQLINILKGEMSFIGPRPWIVDYTNLFTEHQMRRLEVLPGITGLAQCSGRNNINILDRIEIDVKYVDNISLFMDIKIIFKTIIGILKREGFSNNKYAIYDELELLENNYKKITVKTDDVIQRNKKNKKSKSKSKSYNNLNKKELVGSGV